MMSNGVAALPDGQATSRHSKIALRDWEASPANESYATRQWFGHLDDILDNSGHNPRRSLGRRPVLLLVVIASSNLFGITLFPATRNFVE